MASPPDPKSGPPGNLSQYAHLLDPSRSESSASSGAVVSAAPVMYSQEQQEAQKLKNSALQFKPTIRPQQQKQKQKPASKPTSAAPAAFASTSANSATSSTSIPANPPTSSSAPDFPPASRNTAVGLPKRSFADWVDDDDANDFFPAKRQRGGRKNKKKQHDQADESDRYEWDAPIDSRRTNFAGKKGTHWKSSATDLKFRMAWRRCIGRRMRIRSESPLNETENRKPMFAPPSFDPPIIETHAPAAAPDTQPANVPQEVTGEDAYLRRMQLSQPSTQPQAPTAQSAVPPPERSPFASGAVIEGAPVRYDVPLPSASAAVDAPPQPTESEREPSPAAPSRPSKKGFGARMMKQMGWEGKGSGLGAQGQGIVTPLNVRVEKSSKGGKDERVMRGPSGTGRITGGQHSKATMEALAAEKARGPGERSLVIALRGVLRGMDAQKAKEDGTIYETIGPLCGEYGHVERIYVDVAQEGGEDGAPVFVEFRDEMAAVMAVNGLQEREVGGNVVIARYHEFGRYAKGDYQL